jgi:hypothetical protein
MYIQYLREVILPLIQKVMGICMQISLLILHQLSSRLVTLKRLNSVALGRKRTIPTERPPLVGEVSGNFRR